MGTRSTTTVYDGDTPILSFYRQFDGYPSGHGQDLANFLTGKTVVNGIGGDVDPATIVNGPGDLAVRLLTAVKNAHGGENEPGGLYAVGHDQTGDEDYHYDVVVTPTSGWGEQATQGGIVVKVKCFGTPIAEGAPHEFVALAEARESEDVDA